VCTDHCFKVLTVSKHTTESVVIHRSTLIAVRLLLFSFQPLQMLVIYISVLAIYVLGLCTAVVQIKAVGSSARLAIKYQTARVQNLENLTFCTWRIRICLKVVIISARVDLQTLLFLHVPCYVTFRNVKLIIIIIIMLLMIINYMELIYMITTFKQNG